MQAFRVYLFCIIMCATGFAIQTNAAERLSGDWLTADGSSHVRFQPCKESTCGHIIWLREPIDPATKKAWLDKFNPDETLKHRPLIGLSLLTKLTLTSGNKYEGSLYNPLDGQTYSGIIKEIDRNKLELKGCTLAGLLCQTEIWTRVVS